MRNPRLTVLTTVFNAERYLGQTIESILTQDFADFEYLIVDDGSTDGTAEILRQWAARDPRIVIERIPHNGGIAKALNRGLALARGRYIGRQDADDLCVGQRLGAQVALLDREPGVVLVSANVRTVDEHGRWIGNSNVDNPPALFPYLLNFSNAAAGAGSQGMFRRDVARELGGFCEELTVSVDYEFCIRLVQRGQFVILPCVGLHRRIHDGQVSVRLLEQQRRNTRTISRRLLDAYLGRALSDEEFSSVASMWLQEARTGVAATGHRVLSEAYARFAAAEPNVGYRRRVRRITAARWAISAITLMRRGALAEATRHLFYVLRWHPLGLADGAAFVAERSLVRLLRAIRSAR